MYLNIVTTPDIEIDFPTASALYSRYGVVAYKAAQCDAASKGLEADLARP